MTAVQTWSIISRGLERNLNSIRVNLLYTSASNMPHGKTDFFVVSNFFTYKKSPQPIIFVWDFKTARTRERLLRHDRISRSHRATSCHKQDCGARP
jgi:hypothetical protein